ncbi:MAG TPA: YbhB/YbcL family Raf kinase inhibitor-like protein [Luteimonas sp.]
MATALRNRMWSSVLGGLVLALTACGGEPTTAFDSPATRASGNASMALQSTAFGDGEPIPRRYSDYGDGVSPALSWTPVAGAAGYALLMEDPDADRPEPYVHWVAWNIPAEVASLPEGLADVARVDQPAGMRQGVNDRGSVGYFGPRPPEGSGVHHYQLQLFALDTMLELPDDADRAALVRAMRGHVLARARLTGTHAAPGETIAD